MTVVPELDPIEKANKKIENLNREIRAHKNGLIKFKQPIFLLAEFSSFLLEAEKYGLKKFRNKDIVQNIQRIHDQFCVVFNSEADTFGEK